MSEEEVPWHKREDTYNRYFQVPGENLVPNPVRAALSKLPRSDGS